MYYVYILETAGEAIYTGSTPDLRRRVQEHRVGECLATRNLRPVKLVWFCAFPGRLAARRFENYLKTGSGFAFRNKRLIIGNSDLE